MGYGIRKEYIGHLSQMFRVNNYRMTDGKADGIRATDVRSRLLDFTVLADRGMDIPYMRFKGTNLGYISPCGCVAPQYFDERGSEFIRGFTAGFLTTCGLRTMGAPCEFEGKAIGLHGRVSFTPADTFVSRVELDKDGVEEAVLEGTLREGVLFGENLTLRREIRCGYLDNFIRLTDTVINEGFRTSPHMILYHFNMGYPLLDESAELIIPAKEVKARDRHAETGLDKHLVAEPPTENYQEMCYFYKMKSDENKRTCAALYNHNLKLGVAIHFDVSVLDHFIQWKMLGKGEYVMGLEPANATPTGIQSEYEQGHVKYLKPGESVRYNFIIQMLDGQSDLESILSYTDRLK